MIYGSFDAVIPRVSERTHLGQPIGAFQLIQAKGRRLLLSLVVMATALGLTNSARAAAQFSNPDYVDNFVGSPRVIVLTDIDNEPDDQMSFVRLLLYSNELDLESLIATTSTWQKNRVQPEIMHKVIAAYDQVRPNLLKHAPGWPPADKLDAIVMSGQPTYGMTAVGPDKMSRGAEAIIQAVDRPDPRPVWVTIWGGANTLAQALLQVRSTRPPAEVDKFLLKLRVSAISDQDDAGPWIRREFPALHYIVKPSSPDASEYVYASWTGISGDVYYRNCSGADSTTITNDWLEHNIRAKGPLGKVYPRFAFIMEGDTPSFLGLTNNGLNSYRNQVGAAGAGGTSICSLTARRMRYGLKEAICSNESLRKALSLATTVSLIYRIRRQSGAGAVPFSTNSPHAWIGQSTHMLMRTITRWP